MSSCCRGAPCPSRSHRHGLLPGRSRRSWTRAGRTKDPPNCAIRRLSRLNSSEARLLAADAEIIWEDPPAEATDRRGSAPAPVQAKSRVEDNERPRPASVEADPSTATREPEPDPSSRTHRRPTRKGPIAATPVAQPARHDDPTVVDRHRKERSRKPSVANPAGRGQTRDKPAIAVTESISEPRKRRPLSPHLLGRPRPGRGHDRIPLLAA